MWSNCVRRLAASAELRLLSARAEAPYGERVAHATGATIDYFDDVPEWKAAIGAAPALVAPDSGAMHVAGIVGTPVVGVFPGGRDFALQVARWAPWAAPHRIVRAEHWLAGARNGRARRPSGAVTYRHGPVRR